MKGKLRQNVENDFILSYIEEINVRNREDAKCTESIIKKCISKISKNQSRYN